MCWWLWVLKVLFGGGVQCRYEGVWQAMGLAPALQHVMTIVQLFVSSDGCWRHASASCC